MAFVPDNLHMTGDGSLVTAGMLIDHPACGGVSGPEEFNLEEFASCPRPFIVKAINPKTMETRDLVRGPADKKFSNITTGLPVAEEVWIGTFSGDRVAYRSLKQRD